MVGYESIGVGKEETGTWYGPIHRWCSHCPMSTIPVEHNVGLQKIQSQYMVSMFYL